MNENDIVNSIHDQTLLPYTVGALLYSPAVSDKIAFSIISGKFNHPYSLALCLEDSIHNDAVLDAENQVVHTLKTIYNYRKEENASFYLPKIFIRVREPRQVISIYNRIEKYNELLTGFIFPKYSIDCAQAYSECINEVNQNSMNRIYMMPIIESDDVANLTYRYSILQDIKQQLDSMSPFVLNVRVGGNDFCRGFGIRRHCDETIYDIMAVAGLLGDIITIFSKDYVVSGPVWEYFSGENNNWELGLRKEIKYDLLNGFIGKTIIHPNQISIVNDALKVYRNDYEDALSIINFNNHSLQVQKSESGERMNEVKTHLNWAKKEVILAKIYGVK